MTGCGNYDGNDDWADKKDREYNCLSQIPPKIEDVEYFVAWVNTLCCDCSNLYRLARIYERDHEKIKQETDVLRHMEYLDEVKL